MCSKFIPQPYVSFIKYYLIVLELDTVCYPTNYTEVKNIGVSLSMD